MRHIFLLLLLSCGSPQTRPQCPRNGTTSIRRKRSLTFPKGSAFVLTAAFLKPIMLKKPANWNFDLEFDMTWPIPTGIEVHGPLRRRASFSTHRRHRRELYSNLELALDSQGLPGNRCILRALCESKFILNPPGVSLVEDLLGVVFSYPAVDDATYDAYDDSYARQGNCDTVYPCPFSLAALINYHQHHIA